MRKLIASLAIVGALAATSAGAAFAASDNHVAPGTPGAANCVGQTNAYLAQAGQAEGIHGIGGIAKASGYTTQEVETIVQEYCAQ